VGRPRPVRGPSGGRSGQSGHTLLPVSTAGALGILWLAAGVVLGLRWWNARGLEATGRSPLDLPSNARFGQARPDGSRRRLQAMRLAYAAGTMLVAAGLLTGLPVVLAFGAAAVNLGTIYRYLVVALDLDSVDTPLVVVRSPRTAGHFAPARLQESVLS
jgi:hypothetical protein